MKRSQRSFFVLMFLLLFQVVNTSGADKTKTPVELSAEGKKALNEYESMLSSLRKKLKAKIPKIDPAKLKAFKQNRPNLLPPKKIKPKKKPKINTNIDGILDDDPLGDDFALDEPKKKPKPVPPKKLTEEDELKAAEAIISDINNTLSNDSLDDQLIKCTVLTKATPRGLAEYAQKGAKHKKLIDDLLANPQLMKKMVLAGGSKGGRYGKTMEIYTAILNESKKAHEGVLNRVALAVSLELAAPELCGYKTVDPLKRYQFYEKSYLEKQLDKHFASHSVWLYRCVINDPHSEEDMLWMREMLWNYRPDFILAPDEYSMRIVGLMNSEFGHKPPEYDEKLPTSRMQQTIDCGGRCGPKAFFGRCLGRSFGVPVWGARVRSHTAMTYWSPKGWNQILGVGWSNGYWVVDSVDSMKAHYFRLMTQARRFPGDFIKACRAQWFGNVLGEERVDGMDLKTGGLWNALALNQLRSSVLKNIPVGKDPKRPHVVIKPWVKNIYPKDTPKWPEEVMAPNITPEAKKINVDNQGKIHVPSVACISPTTHNKKIVFMKNKEGEDLIHYKRWELPEELVYEITAPESGEYQIVMNVVTVNRNQFFQLTVNDDKPIKVDLPYTVGKWGASKPVTLSLRAGKNKMIFTRTVPENFKKEGYKFAGPQFGGITLKTFTLTPK